MITRDLIAMRTEVCHRTVAGAKSGYACAICGADMTLFPSGQRMLKEVSPTPRLVCDGCAAYQAYDTFESCEGAFSEAAQARKGKV